MPLIHQPQQMASIPTIDISPFIIDTDLKAKRVCAEAVYKACTDTGFFLITNYNGVLPQEKLDRMFQMTHEFFKLPSEQKAKLKSKENRGYFALGEENLSTVYTQLNEEFVNKELGDFKEGLDIGREVDDSEDGLPFRRKNDWPASLGDQWKADALDYFATVTKIGHILMRIFSHALNMDEHWFEDKLDKPLTLLRMLHYPPLPAGEARFGCGAHSDYGCCTILAQDGAGGLQLLNKEGNWIDVPCAPNTLVVNIGDMMQRWTNDTFKSTIHRVINPTGKHRFSIPFFFDPSYDAEVACLESCKKDKALYPPIKFGDHLTNMYNVTFKAQQKHEP